jgi:hypothetical protein
MDGECNRRIGSQTQFLATVQAKDDDGIFQWEIARFETVEGRHFGRWVSDQVDLSAINEVDIRHRDLADRCRAASADEISTLRRDIESFHDWVESVSVPIRQHSGNITQSA